MVAPRRYFFQIAIPFFFLYCFFVVRTPQEMFSVDSPFWNAARITVFIFWSVVIFSHLKPNLAWNQKAFITGVVFGGGWLAVLSATEFLLGWHAPPQRAHVLATVATGIFYGILSALWSCQSPTFWRRAVSSFLFFLLQAVLDLILHVPFMYVE